MGLAGSRVAMRAPTTGRPANPSAPMVPRAIPGLPPAPGPRVANGRRWSGHTRPARWRTAPRGPPGGCSRPGSRDLGRAAQPDGHPARGDRGGDGLAEALSDLVQVDL